MMARLGTCLAAALLLGACTRDRQSEQLAALDDGLSSGLLTRQEYEARRAAVLRRKSPLPVTAQRPPTSAATAPGPADSETVSSVTPPTALPKPAPVPAARVETVKPKPKRVDAVPVEQSAAAAPTIETRRASPVPAHQASDDQEPAALAGCEDAEPGHGKEKGPVERFFPAPRARVREAAINALSSLDFNINRESATEIEASRKRHLSFLGSGGEKLLLRFEDAGANGNRGTRVIAETKKTLVGRAGQKSWTNAVLAQTGCMLRRR